MPSFTERPSAAEVTSVDAVVVAASSVVTVARVAVVAVAAVAERVVDVEDVVARVPPSTLRIRLRSPAWAHSRTTARRPKKTQLT
jgi:hypothetical protein